MLAPPMSQETQALARTFLGRADADVVEVAEPKPVNGKPPAADVATDFTKSVPVKMVSRGDAQNADAVDVRRAD